MTRLFAIAQRELASFFRLPIGWVVIALYLALNGVLFGLQTLNPGAPATMREFFGFAGWLMLFIAPAISMRLLSEELRSGTIEPVMTAPVSDWELVFGKYLAGVGFLAATLAPTAIYVVILRSLAEIDFGPILAGYLGLTLLGMVYLAAGTLFSALSANQTVAFLATLFFLLFLRLATVVGPTYVGAPFDRALYAMSVDLRIADFAKGVIDTAHVVFFAAAAAWLLVLAVVALESRRWR